MVATCPVKSLVFGLETVRTDRKPQPTPMNSPGYLVSCSIDNAVVDASLVDLHKPGGQKIISLLWFAVLLFRPPGIASTLKPPFAHDNHRKAVPVPLFLKNSSWLL